MTCDADEPTPAAELSCGTKKTAAATTTPVNASLCGMAHVLPVNCCVGPSSSSCNEPSEPPVPTAAQKIPILLARLDLGEPPPDMDIDVGHNCEMMRAFATTPASPRSHHATRTLDRCLTAGEGNDDPQARWACRECTGDLRR